MSLTQPIKQCTNELTQQNPSHQDECMNSQNAQWIQGWMDALSEVRSEIIKAREGVLGSVEKKSMDGLFDKVKHLETHSFNYMPTIIAQKLDE